MRTWRKSLAKCVYRTQWNADRFRSEWAWVDASAARLEKILVQGRWNDLPAVLASLLPRFSDIKLNKMTRTPDLWAGCYEKLLREGATEKATVR